MMLSWAAEPEMEEKKLVDWLIQLYACLEFLILIHIFYMKFNTFFLFS